MRFFLFNMLLGFTIHSDHSDSTYYGVLIDVLNLNFIPPMVGLSGWWLISMEALMSN